jgi:hypothetical protein
LLKFLRTTTIVTSIGYYGQILCQDVRLTNRILSERKKKDKTARVLQLSIIILNLLYHFWREHRANRLKRTLISLPEKVGFYVFFVL